MGEGSLGLSYLLDTNVWLERLLDQERSEEVRRFLDGTPDRQLAMTEFAYYSIGLALTHAGKRKAFEVFVRDVFVDGSVARIGLASTDVSRLLEVMQAFDLDFDDACQYTAAEKFDLTLISFDSDFDRTERGRKIPADVLEK